MYCSLFNFTKMVPAVAAGDPGWLAQNTLVRGLTMGAVKQ